MKIRLLEPDNPIVICGSQDKNLVWIRSRKWCPNCTEMLLEEEKHFNPKLYRCQRCELFYREVRE